MRSELPSGEVTLLFTDVQGSTRLLHELGAERYAAALAEHRAVVRAAFSAEGGIEVDTQGDAFLVAFASARAAVAAAAAAQEALAAGPIRVRMGLHTGRPHLAAEGYVGEDVHLGARIGAAGHGGQVLLSTATRALLDGDADVSALGEHRLKDFARPVALFQLGPGRFPPLKTISNTNLPRPVSSFVGRVRAVADVVALLRGPARLVTLTGPGGSGKTRLALEAASELVGEFRAGVFWVGLAPVRDPRLVPDEIGRTLGTQGELAAAIGERELLLLLDNLEQVIESAPDLSALLRGCPNLRLLVTSRELLRVDGETEYAVQPLAPPDAATLFATRAGVDDDPAVPELCRRLDNLPLALELAAARARVLSPRQILDRIERRLDLFEGGRDRDPRQRTLRATIAWSFELLTPEEKLLLTRLAVFRGGATLDAAESVAEANLDTLQSLVDKSLVRRTGDRFWMLETIREFALELLDDVTLAEQHARHYLALAQDAFPHFGDADPKRWLDRIESEHDNLRAALDHFEEAEDTQHALQLCGALYPFWYMRDHYREAKPRIERLLAADARPTPARARALAGAAVMAASTGDVATLRRCADETTGLSRELGDDWGVAYGLFLTGMAAAEAKDFAGAVRATTDGLERFRALGDDYFARQAMLNLGYFDQVLGERVRARELLEAALEEARRAGNEVQQARALGQLAVGARRDDRLDDALALLLDSLPLWARFGDRAMTARDLRRLARVLAQLGRAVDAACVLSASEAMRAEVGHWESWIGDENAEILESIHAQLDAPAFDCAWEDGRELSVEAAIEIGRRGR